MEKLKWLFICGAPRSGTTIVQQVVNLLPNIKILCETDIGTAIHRVFTTQPPKELGRGLPELWRYPQKPVSDGCYDIACTIRGWFGNLTWFGDKNPHYSFPSYWEIIDSIFGRDEIKWIATTRDISESSESISVCFDYPIEEALEIVKACHKGIMELQKTHDVLTIRHKFLNERPKDCIIELTNFLEVGFNNDLLEKSVDLIVNGNVNRCLSYQKDKIYSHKVEFC